MLRNYYNKLILLLIAISVGLLASQVYGLYQPPISSASSGSIPGYHFPTKTKESLLAIINDDGKIDFERFNKINEAIYFSIAHGEPAMLRFEHSWVLWLLAKWKGPTLRYTQNPSKIMMAEAAICSQTARLIVSIAQSKNIEARLVSLNGHVVAELFIVEDDKWIVADPDFGVIFPFDVINLTDKNNQFIVENSLIEKGHGNVEIETYRSVIYNGYTKRHPLYEAHEPKPEFIERWSVILSWILPLIGIFFGFALFSKAASSTNRNTL